MFLPNENELLNDVWNQPTSTDEDVLSVARESADENIHEQPLVCSVRRSGRGKNKARRKIYDKSLLER